MDGGASGCREKVSFSWLISLLVLTIVFIPASAAWAEEFRYWYYKLFRKDQDPAMLRLTYAIFMTLISIAIVAIIYYSTDLFRVYR